MSTLWEGNRIKFKRKIMETQVLTDPTVKPENNVLKNVLGKNFGLYKEFVNKINEKNLTLEWNYYKDGKSWLCKILNKNKNICWLSVWNTGFKLTYYFNEKTINGIRELEINDDIKNIVKEIKPIGKLLPIILLVKNKKIMNGGIKLLEYKMTLK
jgi:hypothetical protein